MFGSWANRNDNAVEPVRGRPSPKQRRVDRFVVDLWVAAVPVLDLQPLTKMHPDAMIDERLAAGVQPGLVTQRGDQDLQAFAEGIVAEVLEACSLDSGVHQLAR
jgi:hypothetical protein